MRYFILVIFIVVSTEANFVHHEELNFQILNQDICSDEDRGGPACNLPVECCCKTSHNTVKEDFYSHVQTSTRVLCQDLTSFPTSYPTQTLHLEFSSSSIAIFPRGSLSSPSLANVTNIYISKFIQLVEIQDLSFADLPRVNTIIVEDAPHLQYIGDKAFSNLPSLQEIKFLRTGLVSIPSFHMLSSSHEHLTIKIISSEIERIPANAMSSLPQRIKILSLSRNPNLHTLEERSFEGLHTLTKLDISHTSVMDLPTNGLKYLREIRAENTPKMVKFPVSSELPSLREAKLTYPFHCCTLGDYGFGKIFETDHKIDNRKRVPCVENQHGNLIQISLSTSMALARKKRFYEGSGYEEDGYLGDIYGDYSNVSDEYAYQGYYGTEYLYEDADEDYDYQHGKNGFVLTDGQVKSTNHTEHVPVKNLCVVGADGKIIRDVYVSKIKCNPIPDAFNPCENVLGTPALPILSWTVGCLAIVGNLFVILVLSVVCCDQSFAHHHHLTVSKFLVLNLALADLCMGVYLLMLSFKDAMTSGEYYKHGVEWQTGVGCNIAGFLAILSAQLSIYILCIISIERWYAIHFAIHLDKRMTMRCARFLVLVGWILSVTFALLPNLGVNNYKKTSICLPMDTSTKAGKAYVALLLLASIVSFFVVVTCYLWMYTTVRTVNDSGRHGMFRRKRRSSNSSSKTNGAPSPTTSTADATIAKRMAILVFTNFACFFPISFFVLTAAVGHPLISISQSKILLVIFFPLNSCCNPFLYAILTKSFRRDLLTWLTSRGYCIHLASKRHGAKWRRQSATGGKKDTVVRRKIQQCVKYVVRYKAVSLEREIKENNNVKQTDFHERPTKPVSPMPSNDDNKIAECKFIIETPAKPSGNELLVKIEEPPVASLENLDNIRVHFQNDIVIPKQKKGFFKNLSYIKKKSKSDYCDKCNCGKDCLTMSYKQALLNPTVCWRKSTNNNCCSRKHSLESQEEDDKGALKPFVRDGEDKDDFFDNANSFKLNHPYTKRFRKPRHSTTTIETRITVNSSQKANNEQEPFSDT